MKVHCYEWDTHPSMCECKLETIDEKHMRNNKKGKGQNINWCDIDILTCLNSRNLVIKFFWQGYTFYDLGLQRLLGAYTHNKMSNDESLVNLLIYLEFLQHFNVGNVYGLTLCNDWKDRGI